MVTDVFGKTGILIINALIDGQTDPHSLADNARGSLVKKRERISEALLGNVSVHHRYMLAASMEVLSDVDRTIKRIDQQISECLQPFTEEFSLLQTIPGVGPQAAIAIIAEIGTEMTVFPSSKHLASWCGISPGNNESAGKSRSGKITQGDKFLKSALVESAWHSCRNGGKDSFLKRKFISISARRGKKKAVIAVAHKILIAAYYILKNKESYQEPDNKTYLEKRKQALIKKHLRRLQDLGITIPSQL